MNRIKYIHLITGEIASIKIKQGSWKDTILGSTEWGRSIAPTLCTADRRASRAGFVRAGLRWRGAAARAALKARALKNALVDNAELST